MTGSQILHAELEAIKQDLIAKHRSLGMEASGDWIGSVEVQTNRLSGVIKANHYTEQLVHGRPPTETSTASSPTLKEVIEKWIYDKGIQPLESNMTISSLAFVIARKIHREGTEYFKQGGTDLVESVNTPQRIQQIIDRVTVVQVNLITSEITGFIQKMAA